MYFNKSVEERVEEQVTEKLMSLTVETQHGAQAAGAASAAVMSQPIISLSVDPKLGETEFAPTPCLLHELVPFSGGGRLYKHNCRLWSLTIPEVIKWFTFYF